MPDTGGLVHVEAPDAAVNMHTPEADVRRWAGELLNPAQRVACGLQEASVVGCRVCVRPMPADGQPILGWLPGAGGWYVAVTHSGVTLGLRPAELITADLAGGTPTAELGAVPARPLHRFRAGGSLTWPLVI